MGREARCPIPESEGGERISRRKILQRREWMNNIIQRLIGKYWVGKRRFRENRGMELMKVQKRQVSRQIE